MKHFISKKIYIILIIASAQPLCLGLPPLLNFRSQEVDAARELAGWTQLVNIVSKDKIYGNFAVTTQYTKSFNYQDINKSLFGLPCGHIVISGSQVANRRPTDLVAENFYLPSNFISTLQFKPYVKNAIIDLQGYIGFDQWISGLFLQMHMPIVWTKWDLNFIETIINHGTSGPTINLLPSFSCFANGLTIKDHVSSDPVQYRGLAHAKFNRSSHTKTGIADLSFIIGYDFLRTTDAHLGVGLKVVTPTGNRPDGYRLFQPIVGNGKFWELGAHITGHQTIWENPAKQSTFGLYCDANITHFFKSRQKRVFDLKNKPLSRYFLVQNFSVPVIDSCSSQTICPHMQLPTLAPTQFTPLANLTAQEIYVHINIQADIAAQLTYVHDGFNWDLGYNFWARSCEKLSSEKQTPICAALVDFQNSSTTNNPEFISCNDLDLMGTWGMSQKIYTHLNYIWLGHDWWIPYIGVGGYAEFGANSQYQKNNCPASSLSQWSLWMKFGASFN